MFARLQLRPSSEAAKLDTVARLSETESTLRGQIEQLETELHKLGSQVRATRNPRPIKQKMEEKLRAKKELEDELAIVARQLRGFKQTDRTARRIKLSVELVKAQEQTANLLARELKAVNLDRAGRVADQMEDLQADAEELEQLLSRTYDIGDTEVDEDELAMYMDGEAAEDAEAAAADYLEDPNRYPRPPPSVLEPPLPRPETPEEERTSAIAA
jgi:myosin heavy subunit